MSLQDQQESGHAGKRRVKRSKPAEAPHNYHYDLGAANGAGTCAMAASFCEVLQDSRLQHWRHDAPYNQGLTAAAAAAAPLSPTAASASSSGASSPYAAPAYSVERPEALLPRKSPQIHTQRPLQGPGTLDPRSFRAVVGIQATRSPAPSDGEQPGDTGDAAPQTGAPGQVRGFPRGDEAARREYHGGLNAELNNLRIHLLQRANGTHVP